ncbi:zinc metallopeptidase [Synergistaceae bacterium OttesenSCG-928-D05]|nr:zinc metallopeptidase [Synergistaceae bacterium OttesenSCG-928-D05]
MMYPFYDPTILLLIPALLFSMWAQFRVKSTFSKYSEVDARKNVSADQVSRALLDQFGLQGIRIERVAGQLTDHYDPSAKVLRLSDSVAGNHSIAAIGVAAHEVGHAIQDKEDYKFMRVRNAIVPVVNIGSMMSMPLFLLGLVMGWMNMLNLGILLFCGVLVFHLVTLPVEFDASARALKVLSQTGLLASDEIGGARAVLNAAALTYVAALVMTVMQLLRLLALRNMRRN